MGAAGADGFGVPAGAAGWLEAVPLGAPVLGAMVPQAATVSATAAPKTSEVNAGARPAGEEGRVVDHFFVRPPEGHAVPPARGRAAAAMP